MSMPNFPDLPVRKCNCSGHCGPQATQLSRRDFIGLVGAGTATALLASPAWAAFDLPADELDRWRETLFAPTQPRRYVSDRHTDARMHLGGIGTGNIEIGSDGQLTTWQLFNTLRDGQVPFYFLAKAGNTTRLLQTTGGPDWPRIAKIEMTGEYPVATLRFLDPELPVQLELDAFTPFAPLDTRASSLPVAAFVFRLKNPAQQEHTVSLAALMQNPVGYDAAGDNHSEVNPRFGGNQTEGVYDDTFTGLLMRATAADDPTLDQPVSIITLPNLNDLMTPPADRPPQLTVTILNDQVLDARTIADPAHTVIWLEDAPATLPEPLLRAARDAVHAGATLVFSGVEMPLLATYASVTGGKPIAAAAQRPDIVFEDFEHGYDRWKVEGDAFGKAPATGTLPNQQAVSGFLGRGLVNTYLKGDDTTGRLTSPDFRIERRFIRFLIGGGRHQQTQIRLVAGNKVVRATSGKDNELLAPATWDVAALEGQMAHIEIVDQQKGPWGHINIDQIEFSDLPGQQGLLLLLEELLPVRLNAIRPAGRNALNMARVEFAGLALRSDAQSSTTTNGLQFYSRPAGKGRVVVAAGSVLEPAAAEASNVRQHAYGILCGLVGARYVVSAGQHPKAPGFGTLALAALTHAGTLLAGFDDWKAAWKTFSSDGRFSPPAQANPSATTPDGRTSYGAVAATVTVPPGSTAELPFVLVWHYPNKYTRNKEWVGCHYTTQWQDAEAVLREAAKNFPELRRNTELFRRTFYDSTLPYWMLDCLTANAAIIRHIGILFRLANGDVYGWEGSNGCCDPTCTHVWGYEQTLARLFPDLEKDMRRIDFKHQQRPDGGVNNRTEVPSPPHPTGERPFADGHASCILKAYREALNHPDDSFFKEYWPNIKKGVEYLIQRDTKTSGSEPTGVLQDDQWNTYDEALHGVTTFISGYYLAALRAGEEWARRMGDTAAAARFHQVFERGQAKLVELCWNGEYFQQHLPDYLQRPGEVGPGCMSDQLIGQWWAHQLGLGYILPQDKTVAALRAVYKYNFKTDLTGWRHAPRAFAGDHDKGLIICTWPKGGRPNNVMLYSDEVWTGIEYQVAAHMIYEGLVEEGFAIVKAARERYGGIPRAPIQRNPWNEIECGGHYARAMSSWSLLLAVSGWEYDAPGAILRLAPRYQQEKFKAFFTGPEGWGSASQTRQANVQIDELTLTAGLLKLKELRLKTGAGSGVVAVTLNDASVQVTTTFETNEVRITPQNPITVTAGQRLTVRVSVG